MLMIALSLYKQVSSALEDEDSQLSKAVKGTEELKNNLIGSFKSHLVDLVLWKVVKER